MNMFAIRSKRNGSQLSGAANEVTGVATQYKYAGINSPRDCGRMYLGPQLPWNSYRLKYLNPNSIQEKYLDPNSIQEKYPNPNSIRATDEYSGLEPQAGMFDQLKRAQQILNTVDTAVTAVQEMMARIEGILKFSADDDLAEAVCSRIEDLFILLVDLRNRTTFSSMLPPILAYIKSWSRGKALTYKVVEIVRKIMTENSDGDEEDTFWDPDEVGLTGQSGWFEANWKTVTKGHFGKKLAGVINVLILGGLLPESIENKMTEEIFKVLHVNSMRKKDPSIWTHIFSTLDWVVDSVIPALTSGNLLLLLSDGDMEEIDEIYRACLDAVNLANTGQMDKAIEKYGIIDEAGLLQLLFDATIAITTLKTRCKDDPILSREFQTRLINLDKIMTDLEATWRAAGLRVKPFAVLIRGGSSVGKSTLAITCNHVIAKTNGFSEGKQYTVTINGSDKYQSDYRSHHVCVIFDDMGNTRPEKCAENPLFVLIQFINNMHVCALSPEAEKKGKMDVRAKIVLVTTNTLDLGAPFFSVNPSSIIRRFPLILDVELKDHAKDEEGGLHSRYASQPMPDAWHITMNKCKITRMNKIQDKHEMVVIKDKGDIVDLVEYLERETPPYYRTQENIVATSSDMQLKKHCIEHPLFCVPCPKCVKLLKQSGSGPTFAGILHDHVLTTPMPESLGMDEMSEPLPDTLTVEDLVPGEDGNLCKLSYRKRLSVLVKAKVPTMKDHLRMLKEAVEKNPYTTVLATLAAIGGGIMAYNHLTTPVLVEQGAIISQINAVAATPRQIVARDETYRKVFSNQMVYPDASSSTTLAQLECRIDRNLHIAYIQEYDEKLKTVSGEMEWCNSFPIGGTEWAFVGHQFIGTGTWKVKLMTHPGFGIKTVTALVNQANIRPMFGTDGVIVDIPDAGSTTPFTKYMPRALHVPDLKPGTPIYIYRAHRKVLDSAATYVPPSSYKFSTKIKEVGMQVVKGVDTYPGFTYDVECYKGMCGAMIFTAGKNPMLIGMHAAGDVAKKVGAAIILSQNMMEASKIWKEEAITAAAEAPLREEIYGVNVKTKPEAHIRNGVHYMPLGDEELNLEVLGETNLPRARFSTNIKKSLIADEIVKETGIPLAHGAPTKQSVSPSRQKHMYTIAKQKALINPKYLEWAGRDMMDGLDKQLFGPESTVGDFIHPISEYDATNGVPGVKGFECINPNTAMGIPLTGPKWSKLVDCGLSKMMGLPTKRFVEQVTDDEGNVNYVYTLKFDPEKADVSREVENCLECFSTGVRVNVLFKTFIKDETLSLSKIEKNKVRIVASCPVAFVISTRMLTLALITTMTYFPREFESAVGVDAAGKDWEFIYQHLKSKSGGIRCGDGDFEHYDMDIAAAFSKKSFEVMKHCQLKGNFTKKEADLLDGVATEVIYPTYDVDGLVVRANKSNPSGHPLTVQINGLDNSLYLRYAYYAMHAENAEGEFHYGDIPLFHEMIALFTFGDDHTYDIHPDEPYFNMISLAEQLEAIGMGYTDANKQKPTVPFKSIDELTFLKRSFHYHPVLKQHVGPLDEKSIFKMLTFTGYSPKGNDQTEAEVTAQNMCTALSHWYLHSPEKYRENAAMYEKFRGIEDSTGHKIGDYYDPPTEAQLIERFEKTTCCYEAAGAILTKQSGVVDMEGVIDRDEMEALENYGDLMGANIYTDPHYVRYHIMHDEFDNGHERAMILDNAQTDDQKDHIRWCILDKYLHEYPEERVPMFGFGIPLDVDSIKFQIFVCEAFAEFRPLWQYDYRLTWEYIPEEMRTEDFHYHLNQHFTNMRMRKIAKYQLVSSIKYLVSKVDEAIMCRSPTNKAYDIYVKLRKKEIGDLPLPVELQEVVHTFLHPKLVTNSPPGGDRVWLSPTALRDPVVFSQLSQAHARMMSVPEELLDQIFLFINIEDEEDEARYNRLLRRVIMRE